ncbi:MAG: hypothetical protein BHW33_02725 [Firmicutes bacterium CAG:137_57_8]|nr:MAG: hypothetical protein BHW33_02725 [Firmicutes bacterium CAG:137_57_8]
MYRSITLPNGAKLLTEFVPGARTAALGFFVGTGSRHERAAESGAAHFIEHMSFKGTQRRDAGALARETDAIVHVVRCFDDPNVTHVEGSTDPLRDIDIINLELILADAEMVTRRVDKAQKAAKGGDKRFLHEVEVFQGLLAHLNEGNLARTYDCSDDDRALIATSDLLTLKKTIYAANLSESQVNEPEASPYFRQVRCCPSPPSWRRTSPSWTTRRRRPCSWRSWAWWNPDWTG